MLASTAARVMSWYFRTRATLDSPVMFSIVTDEAPASDPWAIRSRWDIVPSAYARETLLAETCTVGLALARISEQDRRILTARYDPERGATDRQLAEALGCGREEAREAVTVALEALGGQLATMGLIHMNGKPQWSG